MAVAALGCAVGAVLLPEPASAGSGGGTGAATTDRAPVDLFTPVDQADGTASPGAVVRAGDVRIEVLDPGLLRLEYSPTGHFEDRPTVNVLDRRFPVPAYRATTAGGWLTVRTRQAVLRYRLGSGPFTVANTTLQFSVGGQLRSVRPTWDWECTFDQVCQAGAASLLGGAQFSQTVTGYQSTAGYVGYLSTPGAGARWQVLGAPAGPATLAIRYANVPFPVGPPVHDLSLVVDGRPPVDLPIALTPAADPWATLTVPVTLLAGANSIAVACTAGEACYTTGVDTVSVAPPGAPTPEVPDTGPLGGWIRGFDTDTYNDSPTCTGGEQGATCQAVIQPLNTDGLLTVAGWRLVDDTHSAVWDSRGWVEPRPAGGDEQDGYLFVYGHADRGALRELRQLTGPAPLLPRSLFGVWYSDYTQYSSADIEGPVYQGFVDHDVPLNTLSLDTDWKAPNDWNGWEWNRQLFPDPTAFLAWAHLHHIDVTLNVHSSIEDDDPKLPAAERVAGGDLAPSTCTNGACKVWDWSSVPQAESNFSLQQSFERQGVSFWWLDWCCDDSVVSNPGVTPDSWIDHLYAQEMVDRGQRGFVLARIGGSNGGPQTVYPAGPWSDHTSAIAFTGDAWGTWNTLAAEAALAPAEASIGEPYVSDDIGSYLGPPPTQSGADPPDLYDRWVQLGTFQPILRLHSNNEDRLPWQYPQPVQGITEPFLRLREELIPYSYSLAAQATQTGLPMTSPLYLADPSDAQAYDHPTEYLYGPSLLVAPVTTPGAVATTTVWFPPGRWIDLFTGTIFSGPSTATVAAPLSQMPLFERAGGIVTEEPLDAAAGSGHLGALRLLVTPGASGSFRLYNDAGAGLGYTRGQDTETLISTSTHVGGRAGSVAVTVGPARGAFPGEPTSIAYHVAVDDLSPPAAVTLNGRVLARRAPGSPAAGWSFDPSTSTLVVVTGPLPTDQALTVVETGGLLVGQAGPPLGAGA